MDRANNPFRHSRGQAVPLRAHHSKAGVVSFGLCLAMVLVEVAVLVLAKLGVKLYGGLRYVLGFPINVMLLTFLPCVILGIIGLAQRRGKRILTALGLGLAMVAIAGLVILTNSCKMGAGFYMGSTGAAWLRQRIPARDPGSQTPATTNFGGGSVRRFSANGLTNSNPSGDGAPSYT
jgi:hypothetical protein